MVAHRETWIKLKTNVNDEQCDLRWCHCDGQTGHLERPNSKLRRSRKRRSDWRALPDRIAIRRVDAWWASNTKSFALPPHQHRSSWFHSLGYRLKSQWLGLNDLNVNSFFTKDNLMSTFKVIQGKVISLEKLLSKWVNSKICARK